MKRHFFHFIGLIIIIFPVACNSGSSDGEILFTEENRNWIISGEAEWKFENEELVGLAKDNSGFIMTQNPYDNFYLELEFKPDSTINSGVFVRCTEMDISAIECYEINIWDEHPNQQWRTGAVVGRTEPLSEVSTSNRWNTYKIECSEDRIQAWINESKVVDHKDDTLNKGYIGLQAMGNGTIRFRNVILRLKEEGQQSSP